jgi:hypothetical protein
MAKVKKAQKGQKVAPMRTFTKKDYERKDSVPSEMFPGKMIPRSKSNYENGFNIATGMYDKPAKKKSSSSAPVKKAVPKSKTMKSGGKAFPDLTGDGKVTRADILKGRGVIKKSGGKMKSCKYGC